MEFVVALSPSFGGLYPLASLWRLQNRVPIKIIDHPDFLARDLEIFGQDGCQVTLLLGGASLSRVKPVVFFP